MDSPRKRKLRPLVSLGSRFWEGQLHTWWGLRASVRNGPGRGGGAGRKEMGNRLLALLSHQRPDLGRPGPRVPEDQPTAAIEKDRCGHTQALTYTHPHLHPHTTEWLHTLKEMSAHSSVLAWRIPGMAESLVGCHLWGRTESDTTEVS